MWCVKLLGFARVLAHLNLFKSFVSKEVHIRVHFALSLVDNNKKKGGIS